MLLASDQGASSMVPNASYHRSFARGGNLVGHRGLILRWCRHRSHIDLVLRLPDWLSAELCPIVPEPGSEIASKISKLSRNQRLNIRNVNLLGS